jgi:hypothetical protein
LSVKQNVLGSIPKIFSSVSCYLLLLEVNMNNFAYITLVSTSADFIKGALCL